MAKTQERSLMGVVNGTHDGVELSEALVKHGLVRKNFDKKIKKLVSQRKELLKRLR